MTTAPRIAIHCIGRPHGFTSGWLAACRDRGLEPIIVDARDSNIMETLRGCDIFCWHIRQTLPGDLLAGRHILEAAQTAGLLVFPDRASSWHFDDKIAQKYLFEALEVPMIATWVFYDQDSARQWLDTAAYPLVWKLRRGAGSINVRLLRDAKQGKRLCDRAFAGGFQAQAADLADLRNRASHITGWRDLVTKVSRRPALIAAARRSRAMTPRELGYVLIQEFIPDNQYDIRVTTIDGLCWAFTRDVRPDDFRASGSGRISYDMSRISPDCLQIARRLAGSLGARCLACDFLQHHERGPLLVEMSFGFVPDAVAACPGYWDRDGTWRSEPRRPEPVMLEALIRDWRARRSSDIRPPAAPAS